MEHVAHKDEILLDQRTIEAIALDERFTQGLVRCRVDHHVDRVADGVDAKEHDDRHGDHDHERLKNTLNKKTDHAVSCMALRCRRTMRKPRRPLEVRLNDKGRGTRGPSPK